MAIELITEWVTAAHPRSTVEPDVTVGDLSLAARVLGPTGARFAVMFVDHRLGVDAWWEADHELELAGYVRGWIFAPRQFLRYPQPSAGARPDDPAVVDRHRGDIVLDRALFREMRASGRWPLLLNITRREVGHLVAPRGQVANRLGLHPPASRDRVLHLVPSPLSECKLGRDGIETPGVDARVLAAPRLAGEQREAALRLAQRPLTPARNSPRATGAAPSTLMRSDVARALEVGGPVTTMGTLVTALGLSTDSDEQRLREHLYNLRVEGVIEFDRPLGRFGAIRPAAPPS